jgi:hypothetical protein
LAQPNSLHFVESGSHFIGFEQLSTLGGCIAFGDLFLNLSKMLGQPGFVLMEHSNGMLDKFVDGLVGPALNVLSNKRLKFGPKPNFHVVILPDMAT